MVVRIKGASRPFGIEQVRPLTHTTTTRERRSYPGAADKTGNNRQVHTNARRTRVAAGTSTVGSAGWTTRRLAPCSPGLAPHCQPLAGSRAAGVKHHASGTKPRQPTPPLPPDEPILAAPSPRDSINPTNTPVAPRPRVPPGLPRTHNPRQPPRHTEVTVCRRGLRIPGEPDRTARPSNAPTSPRHAEPDGAP